MNLLAGNTTDAATEKHVPVVEKVGRGFKVTIGSVEHPMATEHFIEWIGLVAGGKSYRQFLRPGESPTAIFEVDAETAIAREVCNLHGLWKAEV
jgi:superoxide reductase